MVDAAAAPVARLGPAAALSVPRVRSGAADFARALLRGWAGRLGGSIIVLVLVTAAAGPVVAPFSPIAVDPPNRLLEPSPAHVLRTDELGRDVFSRVLYAAKI